MNKIQKIKELTVLCNKYCEGKERELINQLHAYRWPVYR